MCLMLNSYVAMFNLTETRSQETKQKYIESYTYKL